MSCDKEREDFEHATRQEHPAFPLDCTVHADGEVIYHSAGTQHRWRGWQARAALASQPPAVQGEPRKFAGWLVSNSEGDDEFINNPTALAGRHYKGRSPLLLEIHETTSGIHSRGETGQESQA